MSLGVQLHWKQWRGYQEAETGPPETDSSSTTCKNPADGTLLSTNDQDTCRVGPASKKKPGQLLWVAPATEQAIEDIIEGPDVIRQRCSECGFQGTKKQVHIHCIQHFCKY